jgi:hypothetical protein
MNIRETLTGWTRWVGQQVVGQDDFLGPQDTRSRDYAVLGTAAGAVAGATIGTITGFHAQKANSIKEVMVGRDIVDTTMNGYEHSYTRDTSEVCTAHDEDGNCTSSDTRLDGWWHHYTPNLTDRVVGHYSEPAFQNTKVWEPLMGGALGALGGGLVGLGMGLGAAALQRALQKDGAARPALPRLSPKAQQDLALRAGAAAALGAALGIAVGTYTGSHAGVLELASQQTHFRSWSVPMTETRTLGYVPSGHYEHNWFGSYWATPSDVNSNADQPVNRTLPVLHRDGTPHMTSTEKTFHTNRYGPILGGIAGGVIGAGVGLAAGLVVGVSDKLLSERNATSNKTAA